MPLLDGQGRLLGRWNLLDLGAAAVLGVSAVLLYLFLARPAQARRLLHDEPGTEAYLAEVLPDRPFLLTLMQPGDAQRHRVTERPLIEFLEKIRSPAEGLGIEGSGREVGLARFRVLAKRGGDGVLMLGESPLKPGGRFRFEPPGYSFLGTVLSVHPESREPDGAGRR